MGSYLYTDYGNYIYGIFVDDKLAYIGQTTNIHQRCLTHRELIETGNSSLALYRFLHRAKREGHTIIFRKIIYQSPISTNILDEAECDAIAKYCPPGNQKNNPHPVSNYEEFISNLRNFDEWVDVCYVKNIEHTQPEIKTYYSPKEIASPYGRNIKPKPKWLTYDYKKH
jgi:hypothetical protein